jgi:ATP-dependent Lon protease
MTKDEEDEVLKVLERRFGSEPDATEEGVAEEVGDSLEPSKPPSHRLFSPVQLAQCLKGLNDETKAVLTAMQSRGAIRRLTLVPDQYRRLCDDLAEEFPNFGEYIKEYLLPFLALGHVRQGALHFPATVLVGPPGVGKTLFVSVLAERLGLAFDRINLETSQASFELVGTSRGWASSQPGRLLRWLGTGCYAPNGIFVMEELDKAGGGDPRYAPINALIQLFEPSTAKSFADQSVPELKVDVSPVNFVCTANSLDGISEPVLSRLLVIEVPPLTPEQAKRVAMRQYERILRDLDLPVAAPELTDAGLEALSAESPRRQRLLLQLAIGRAIAERARELHVQRQTPRQSRGIGFF